MGRRKVRKWSERDQCVILSHDITPKQASTSFGCNGLTFVVVYCFKSESLLCGVCVAGIDVNYAPVLFEISRPPPTPSQTEEQC